MEMANFIGRRIRIITGEGGRTYEGYVHLLDQNTGQISLLRGIIISIEPRGHTRTKMMPFYEDPPSSGKHSPII